MSDRNHTASENRSVASRFKPSMVVWPILFGLVGVAYMLWREMHNGLPDEALSLADHWWVFVILVVLFTLFKDFSGMYRLRVMSGAPLKFRHEEIENPGRPSPRRLAFAFAEPVTDATITAVFTAE